MDGFLLVNKPVGISSFGVVARVRRVISEELTRQALVAHESKMEGAGEQHSKSYKGYDERVAEPATHQIASSQNWVGGSADKQVLAVRKQKVKIGHCGTLDPAAEGLMILVIGQYTKKAGEFSKLDKTYLTEVTLGKSSITGDREGEISVHKDDPKPSEEQVREVLNKFIGQIQQVPPAFSAIKINGQRAYDLARKGEKPELKPRQVTVYSLQLTAYDYPILKFTTKVSSGTYIRTLAEDIGKALGGHAYMSGLTRTEVDKYKLSDAIELENITFNHIKNNLSK